MTNIFYRIYVFTKSHKAISLALLIFLLGGSVFFAKDIRLEENIINVIPKDNEIEAINRVLEGLKMNGRLVFHVYFDDSVNEDPERLIKVSHQFSDSLQQQFPDYISEVKLEFPDTHLETLYSYYTQHLPLYLHQKDYNLINERTTDEGIEKTLEKNYKSLITPMSIVTKTMLIKDPFSLVSLPLQKTRSLQVDKNIDLYQNHLLTKDKRHLIYFVGLSNPPNETGNNGVFIDGANDLIGRFEKLEPSLNIEYFGQAAVAVANAKRIKQDIILTVSLAVAFLFLFIAFFYRNFSIFFIAVTPGLFGAIVAIALLTLTKSSVSVISLGVGSILLGITIDYALHFFTHYKDQKDIPELFKDLTMPLLMSSITTACAFFSLLFLRSEAMADLGFFAGVSILCSAIYTLVVLPHFIITNKESKTISSKKNIVEKAVTAIATHPFYKAKWSILVTVLVSVISLFTWSDYAFESDMLRLNYMPDNLEKYEKNLNEVSTYSANSVYFISTGSNLWEALEAEVAVREKLQDLQEEGLIYSYFIVGDIIPPPSLQKERIARWEKYWQNKNADSLLSLFNKKASEAGFRNNSFDDFETLLKADYNLLKEEDARKLLSVFGEDFIVTNGDSISVVSSAKTSKENKKLILEAFDRDSGSLIFDKGFLTSHLVTLLQEDFNKLVNLSLVVVFFIILLSYGRIELTLIGFAPILISWLWILGMMGLFDIRFNIVNIIICTFIFGLGIDYTIFVMRGYSQDFGAGLKTIYSYKKSIILSAVTTLISIGVLIFAKHPALNSIALLAIIGILSVIFITFTVQPVLYKFLILDRKNKGLIPYTALTLFLSIFAFLYFLLGCFLLTIIRALFIIPFAPDKKRKLLYHWILMLFCKSLIYIMANVKKEVVGKEFADFKKPSVIISNHHSFLDIILLLMFHPKVIMVTNDWVYNSLFFGKVVQYADFISAAQGIENQMEKIETLVKEGFSIVVFPEGTRSGSHHLNRFHKGAFYLADHLKLDIQPVILHGTHYTMPQGDAFHLKSGKVTVKFLPRIAYGDEKFGAGYAEKTKKISKYFKEEYEKLRLNTETPGFFKETIIKNYLYKGPVLEWYLKIKLRLENNYEFFHSVIPANARIVDLGCGYGFLAYALALSSAEREILGVDYDKSKIEVAKNCPVKPANLSFAHGDVTIYPHGKADVFVVSDVLHYLKAEDQQLLLKNISQNLAEGGMIILRDGDSNKKDRHLGTKLTEIFSTKSGFNKTQNELNYISEDTIKTFAENSNLALEIIDNTKLTSNTIFILKSKKFDQI